MPEKITLLVAAAALLGLSLRALNACLRARSKASPNYDQILEGVGYGLGIGASVVAIIYTAFSTVPA